MFYVCLVGSFVGLFDDLFPCSYVLMTIWFSVRSLIGSFVCCFVCEIVFFSKTIDNTGASEYRLFIIYKVYPINNTSITEFRVHMVELHHII